MITAKKFCNDQNGIFTHLWLFMCIPRIKDWKCYSFNNAKKCCWNKLCQCNSTIVLHSVNEMSNVLLEYLWCKFPVQCSVPIALYSLANLSITNTKLNLLFSHIFFAWRNRSSTTYMEVFRTWDTRCLNLAFFSWGFKKLAASDLAAVCFIQEYLVWRGIALFVH